MRDCDQSLLTNYEKQMKHEFDLRERREKMLQDIHDGKEEFGSGGPSLNMGKKRSQKDDGNNSGMLGFLQGMKPGFLQQRWD